MSETEKLRAPYSDDDLREYVRAGYKTHRELLAYRERYGDIDAIPLDLADLRDRLLASHDKNMYLQAEKDAAKAEAAHYREAIIASLVNMDLPVHVRILVDALAGAGKD